MNDRFTLLFLDGWARGFHKVAPEKPECESFHHFENIFQTILGPSVFQISPVLVQFLGSKLAATVRSGGTIIFAAETGC